MQEMLQIYLSLGDGYPYLLRSLGVAARWWIDWLSRGDHITPLEVGTEVAVTVLSG